MAVVVGEAGNVAVSISGTSQPAFSVSVSGGIGPTIVVDGTTTSTLGYLGVQPFIAGANISLSTAGGGITIAAANPPVVSVQGRTGSVVLTLADITAAAASHTHTTTQITSFTAAASAAAPVQSVAGRTGSVSLTTSDISLFTTSARNASPVQSVAGRTGVVTLTTTDVSGFTQAASQSSPVQSVAGRTGVVTLTTSDISLFTTSAKDAAPVQSVAGRTGVVVLSLADVSAASSTHSHAYVQSLNGATGSVSIVAGANVSISTNGTAIEVSATANTNEVAAALWPAFILGG